MSNRFNYKAMQYREFQQDNPPGTEVKYKGEKFRIIGYKSEVEMLFICSEEAYTALLTLPDKQTGFLIEIKDLDK